MNLSVHRYRPTVEFPFAVPTVVTLAHGDWQLAFYATSWHLNRGVWPSTWREQRFKAPIFRYWQVGPAQLRRFTPKHLLGLVPADA